MVPYPAMLDVPHEHVEHVARLLYEHRQARNTRWRKLGCFQQALLTLVHLRKNETFSQLGAGFGVSQATAWRYVDETLDVLTSASTKPSPASVKATTSSLTAPSSPPTASPRTSRTTRRSTTSTA